MNLPVKKNDTAAKDAGARRGGCPGDFCILWLAHHHEVDRREFRNDRERIVAVEKDDAET